MMMTMTTTTTTMKMMYEVVFKQYITINRNWKPKRFSTTQHNLYGYI